MRHTTLIKKKMDIFKPYIKERKIKIGDHLEIKYLMSKTSNLKVSFIGKCTKINNKGIQSNIIIKKSLINSSIEKRFYIYSSLVYSIEVIQ